MVDRREYKMLDEKGKEQTVDQREDKQLERSRVEIMEECASVKGGWKRTYKCLM